MDNLAGYTKTMEMNLKTIYLGGGCFWCTEAIFKSLRGVQEVTPGYMGGTTPNPTYEVVTTGTTGHAEVVRVSYNQEYVKLDDLLDIFFATHDPTSLNKQGNDEGTQYRSCIYFTESSQEESIRAAIGRARAEQMEEKEIVTEVRAATEFYEAENYHQNYYEQHKNQPYCQLVISPKIEKLQIESEEKLT